jgi:hypothetical protein
VQTNKVVCRRRGRDQLFRKIDRAAVVDRKTITEIARSVVGYPFDQSGFFHGADVEVLLRPVARHRHGRRRQEEGEENEAP